VSLDVFTFGEAMLRLSVRPGERLESAPNLDVHVAGSELNVATALAALGRKVAWYSRIPEGPLGGRVLAHLRSFGIDVSIVSVDPSGRLGTYFVELHSPPLPTRVVFDRAGSLATSIAPADIPDGVVESAQVVHLTGITPALSTSCRDATFEVLRRARSAGRMVTVDVNHRAKLWDAATARETLTPLLEEADLVLCALTDAIEVFEITGSAEHAVSSLASRFGLARAVVTDGADGAWWFDDGVVGHVPATQVEVLDRLGAGDAFAAGLLDGLLDGDMGTGLRRGAVLSAVALTTFGDQAVVSRPELESLIAGVRGVDR
jgi:2-dehydro-3-deoxygluconokinase